MRSSITFAREYLKGIKVARPQLEYLCENAIRAGVQGNRGEIFAAEVARANAALNGNDMVEADDLRLGVKLAIAPRGTVIAPPPDMDEEMEPPPPPPPPPPQDEEQQEDAPPAVPEEFMFDVEGVAIDSEVMRFTDQAKSGRSGSRGKIYSDERGRYIKAKLPKGKVRKLAVDATLRMAAPYQKRRRAKEEAKTGLDQTGKVFIETSDVRAKLMARKAGALVVFVVDASGSMALNRMNVAKGAAVSLLTDAYQSRDKVCLITFQGDAAEVVLPPTRSIAMARNRLEVMPCGGGSPLAHALNQAAIVGVNAQKSGDVGEVLVILISDGRANVPLSRSSRDYEGKAEEEEQPMDKKALAEEVLNTSKMLGSMKGFKVLVMDTENKFVSTGFAKEIANASMGKYHYIPNASDKAVASVAASAISGMRG